MARAEKIKVKDWDSTCLAEKKMTIVIRDYLVGDEAALWQVFHSSIHQLASAYYNEEQIQTWAPEDYGWEKWVQRMAGIKPYLAIIDGEVAGYAGLLPSGYIDHFYVSGAFARQGVGTALMRHVHDKAVEQGIGKLTSEVSLAAEKFFETFGFRVEKRQTVVVRGVSFANAWMVKSLE